MKHLLHAILNNEYLSAMSTLLIANSLRQWHYVICSTRMVLGSKKSQKSSFLFTKLPHILEQTIQLHAVIRLFP